MRTRRRADDDHDALHAAVTRGAAPPLRAVDPRRPEVAALLALQRGAGNHAVQRLLSDPPHHRPKADGDVDKLEDEKERGKTPGLGPLAPSDAVLQRIAVTEALKKPSPTRSNSRSSTTNGADPTFVGHVVEDTAAKQWTFALDSVKAKGTIKIVYYSADRYPAPSPQDDSGALKNVKQANVDAVIADLKANRTGIAKNWSAYLAEDLHEDYHWSSEWMPLVRTAANEAEADIGKLSVPSSTAPKKKDAEKVLRPQAEAIFTAKMRAARVAWNAMGDSPGDAPYLAQAPAIDNLVARVEGLKNEKSW